MWVIFIVSALSIAIAGLIVVKIGHKIWISMKRDERKYEKEVREENER